MFEFLCATCPIMLWVITAVEIVFTVQNFQRYTKTKNLLFLLTGLITIGLTYDALILALGCFMQESTLFLALSRLRYILHGGLIPLLFVICAYGLNWKGGWLKAAWIFTGILILLGVVDGCTRALCVEHLAGIWRYKDAGALHPVFDIVNGLLTFGAVIPVIIAGIVVWVKQKTPHLFLAGFLMFLFCALGGPTGLMFYVSMYGEVLMALFLHLYACKKSL